MSIKKNIQKEVKILKEKQDKKLVLESLITKRFSVLPKNVNFNSKIQTNKFFNSLFEEIRYVKKINGGTKILNENLISLFQSLDNDGTSSKVKVKLISFLESKLNMVGFEKEVLTEVIMDTDDKELSELVTNSRFLSRKMSKTFTDKFESDYLKDLTPTTRGIVMSQLDTEEFKREIEDRFSDALDTLMGPIRSNMERKLSDIRDNVFS